MHINFQHTHDKYTEADLLHLQQCFQCQEDVKALDQLKESVNSIPVMVPEEFNWQAIKQRTIDKDHGAIQPKPKAARPYFFQQVIGIAASTFFIALGWLAWSNHQLQNQLEQVLMVNQSLERQLNEDQIPTFRQAKLLNKVRIIEENLIYVNSQNEKLQLLKARQKLVAEMVRYQGEKNEISI
jgi:hypothetical protein